VWVTGYWTTAFMAAVTMVFVMLAPTLVGAFTTDGEVAAVGTRALRIISYGYVLYGWGMVMEQAFNGAGDTMTPTKVNFLCFWLFQIPLAWAFSVWAQKGPDGVFWAITLAYSLSAVVGVALFRRGRWKLKQL
jgi:Na+-driven multidrug efflux pump